MNHIRYFDEMGVAVIANLDVDLLKTFLAIADMGNFTRAAEEVHKTQSAVSMQMKRLEDIIGRPLFARDGRQSRFTADGERLIEYARRIVKLNDEAVSAFTKPELTGTLRFGTPDDYADRFLPEILARFSRTHPLVTVDVDCIISTELFERTRRGEIDLALVTVGCEVAPDEIVRREPLVWVTSTRHSVHMLEPCRSRSRMPAANGARRCSTPSSETAASSVSPIRALIPMPSTPR